VADFEMSLVNFVFVFCCFVVMGEQQVQVHLTR